MEKTEWTGKDDYEVVSLQVSWSSLSILLFLLTLPAGYLLQFLPWRPHPLWLWPLVPPLVILGLSFFGLLSGWLGWKLSDAKGLAKAGVLLNGVVFAIVLAVAILWMAIRFGR